MSTPVNAPNHVVIQNANPVPEPKSGEKTPSNYWKSFIGSMFAPWVKQGPIQFEKRDLLKACIHMFGMAVLGWMALAWMFVERYHIFDFWHGEWEARARVYAYENNGDFMIYSILLVIALITFRG